MKMADEDTSHYG